MVVIDLISFAFLFFLGSEVKTPSTSVAFTNSLALVLSAIKAAVAFVLWPGDRPPVKTILEEVRQRTTSSKVFGTS